MSVMSQVILPRQPLTSVLPTECDFRDTTYFRRTQEPLPTPALVKTLYGEQVKRATGYEGHHKGYFKSERLGLFVKYGGYTTVEEAITQRTIRTLGGNRVPVPEVYGWRIFEGQVFIYMELVNAQTLEDVWSSLSRVAKIAICGQLKQIIDSLRTFRQIPTDSFIGSITGGPPQDRAFRTNPPNGTLATVQDFHRYIARLTLQCRPAATQHLGTPKVDALPRNGEIYLTHADLNHTNILVSSSDPVQIVSIIDWAYAGWYPDYWEWVKSRKPFLIDTTWNWVYLPMVMKSYDEEVYKDWFEVYFQQLGNW